MEKEHIKNICKMGQGALCCKYLCCNENGFQCTKLDDYFKKILDNKKNMIAKGDNCEGIKNSIN